MTRPQVGWIPVLLGDAYALRQLVKLARQCGQNNEQTARACQLLARIEGIEDTVTTDRIPPSDVWGVAA